MNLTVDDCQVVYFNGLTASYKEPERVLLKLTAKYGAAIFSVWVKPPQSTIIANKFKAGGVSCRNGELFVNHTIQPSVPLRTALIMFYAFLKSAPKRVVLVGHSANSISGLFLKKVQKTQLVDLFHEVIVGFTNALDVWSNIRRERTRVNDFGLSALSRDFLGKKYSVAEHDTTFLVGILAQLASAISTESQLIQSCESYEKAFSKSMNTPDRFPIYRGLDRLLSHLPEVVVRKMAEESFSYDSLKRVFQEQGSEGLIEFLTARLIEVRLRIFGQELSSVERNEIVQHIVCFFEEQNSLRNEVASSSGEWQGGAGHGPRPTVSGRSSSLYRDRSGSGPVHQNPGKPTSLLYQILSGANPVYENSAEPTSVLYQVPRGATPVYRNPTEPNSFLNQDPSGAGPAHQNSTESRQRDQEIIQQWNEHASIY